MTRLTLFVFAHEKEVGHALAHHRSDGNRVRERAEVPAMAIAAGRRRHEATSKNEEKVDPNGSKRRTQKAIPEKNDPYG